MSVYPVTERDDSSVSQLGIVAWWNEDDQRGILLDAKGRAKGFNLSHVSLCLLENGTDSGHFVDVEGREQISRNSGKIEFFLHRVDLPSREQVHTLNGGFTPEAANLRSIYEKNSAEQAMRKQNRTAR